MKTRIFRSPELKYTEDEILHAPGVYTEDFFDELKENGFNAIWVSASLRNILPRNAFSEFADNPVKNMLALKELCRKAADNGIKTFLYLDEPRAFPVKNAFWEKHPELKGHPAEKSKYDSEKTFAVCASHQLTVDFLFNASAGLFATCPELAGLLLRTRGEHNTHCYSVTEKTNCPLCRKRELFEIVSEIINAIAAGASSVKPAAEIIALTDEWPYNQDIEVIQMLRDNVIIMPDFESGSRKLLAGANRLIKTNALSIGGPAGKFLQLYNAAAQRGLRVYSKFQTGTTAEMPGAVSLPLVPNIFRKVQWMKKNGIKGILGGWNYGTFFSLNTFAFEKIIDYELWNMNEQSALEEIAVDFFKLTDVRDILKAWELFTKAFEYFPSIPSFLEFSPLSYALAYPPPLISMKNEPQIPMKSSLELPRKPYPTRLSDAANRLPYSEKYPYLEVEDMDVEDIANCLYNVEKYFGRGLQIYRSALAAARAKQVQAELTNARLIHHNLESISRIFKAYTLLNSEKTDIRAFKKILQNEITNLELALPLLRNEKRFGKSIPYGKMFFSETDVKQKLKTLKEELKYTETPG